MTYVKQKEKNNDTKQPTQTRYFSYRWQQNIAKFFHALIVIGICFVILYPLFVKITTSFMEEKTLRCQVNIFHGIYLR